MSLPLNIARDWFPPSEETECVNYVIKSGLIIITLMDYTLAGKPKFCIKIISGLIKLLKAVGRSSSFPKGILVIYLTQPNRQWTREDSTAE